MEGSGTVEGSGTGPILLSQAAFQLAHISNSGLVPLSSFRSTRPKEFLSGENSKSV